MAEFLYVKPEKQFFNNNALLADAVQERLPFSGIPPEGHNIIAQRLLRTPDGYDIALSRTGFYSGVNEIEQPITVEIAHPDQAGTRSIELYDLIRDVDKSPRAKWHCSSSEFLFAESEAGRITVPTLGYAALRKLETTQLFGSRGQRLKRKEKKIALEMLQISMDNDRVRRLLGLIELAH